MLEQITHIRRNNGWVICKGIILTVLMILMKFYIYYRKASLSVKNYQSWFTIAIGLKKSLVTSSDEKQVVTNFPSQ